MRKGFNGLSGLMSQYLQRDLLSGDVFIFINKGRDKLKLLSWEAGGFVIYYKRLEQGTFELPVGKGDEISLSYAQLFLLLEGIGLDTVKHRKRYQVTG
ncbi:MAG: IS66 family insertion sequence element accessory protein TnpB [Cytophagales bacterium]|nr:IS66 family insertion sequence element accessory protein TnpB [Cytophagales bacterium]